MTDSAVLQGRWIFSAWKHLRRYDATAQGRMGAVASAGRAGDLLGRLRMLRTYPIDALVLLAADAGISRVELEKITLPILEGAGGLRVERESAQVPAVTPLAVDQDDVMRIISAMWAASLPTPEERVALSALIFASAFPRTEHELIEAAGGSGVPEETVRRGIELACSVSLVKRRHVADFATDLYYNEFMWGDSVEKSADALLRLPAHVKEGLVSMLDELHQSEGRPAAVIESASPELVRFAAANGIIEQTTITTTDGRSAAFAFTPRLRGFGIGKDDIGDDLDQIRLVIASFAFAHHHALNKLDDPVAFLSRLIEEGRAGSASPIATDYGALEKQQIVSVEPIFPGAYNHRFVAVKRDSLVVARDTMLAGEVVGGASPSGGGALLDSRMFSDPVETRARLASQPGDAPLHQETLLAAVRDAAQSNKPRPDGGQR